MPTLRQVTALSLLAGVVLASAAALAAPTDPVTVDPIPNVGVSFSPGFRPVGDLPNPYIEEEYVVSGAATVFTYEEIPTPLGKIVLEEDVPWKTRLIVRRPPNAQQFKGTVVIEWWNSTATFDTAPVWDPSAEYFSRAGIIYIGVTNATQSIDHLVSGCSLFGILPPTCSGRYDDLSLPDNGVAFEMMSQIANMLKNDPSESPLPADFEVERIFHAGQSQQGGSMVTYATAFHFPVNDGYFIQAAGSARRINDGPQCGSMGSLPYPDCTPRLTGTDLRVRTDLPVPVYRAQTETDMGRVLAGGTRQTDTATFRYYEMAGTTHTPVHDGVEVLPPALFPPFGLSLENTCLFPINSLADGPVFGSYLYNAMWDNMVKQVRDGISPPHGDLIETDMAGAIARDAFGNALGGIRLPMLEAPLATYGPHNTVNTSLPPFLQPLLGLFCVLAGTVTPLPDATLMDLYHRPETYINAVIRSAYALRRQGFLLKPDLAAILDATAAEAAGLP